MYRIFVVEDDPGIAGAVCAQGKNWGLEMRACEDFQNVMGEFSAFSPHLVLMDIGLPFYNGYYWCQEIRKVSSLPVIFLSSASDNMNIIMAMNMGGDDFIPKPFDLTVLIAKIQAMLRRAYDFGGSLPVLEHRQRRGTKILRSIIPLLILTRMAIKRYIFLRCFTPAQRTESSCRSLPPSPIRTSGKSGGRFRRSGRTAS